MIITPEYLREVATSLALQHGEDSHFVKVLLAAADEVATQKATSQASTELALMSARAFVEQRRLYEQMQEENSRLHNKNANYRAIIDGHTEGTADA